jgi:anthranilate phosphoribosyltransferase
VEIRDALARVVARQSLTRDEIETLVGQIMDGAATPAQIAGWLIGLRMKGETVEEIVGAARAMRARATKVMTRRTDIIDTCGTGGDRSGTFNISTAAALIAAGAGACIAKHGNRAMSGTVGGADVLEAAGVRIDLPAAQVAACIDEIGFGFLFAPTFHPAMRNAAGPRRELGVRTLFNLLGPLSNPAGARRQVVGVFASEWTEPLAQALGQLGCAHALVVHGEDGLDEITLCAPTRITEIHEGELRTYRISPQELGLPMCRPEDLRCGDRQEAVAILRSILSGADGPRKNVAVINAAAALYVAGLAPSLVAGIRLAEDSIRSGRAAQKLARLVERSNS